jgi:hypothetical protein
MATTLIPPFSLKLVTLPHGGATVKFNFNPFGVDSYQPEMDVVFFSTFRLLMCSKEYL